MKNAQFEKSSPLLKIIAMLILCVLAYWLTPLRMMHQRLPSPKTYHWVEGPGGCERDDYIEDKSGRSVARVFHCDNEKTWNAFTVETFTVINEDYPSKAAAQQRIEKAFN